MPKTVMSWYCSKPASAKWREIEKIVRDFVGDLGDEGGVFELQHQHNDPPSKCDSDIVVEVHYGQTDDRDQIQHGAGEVMKKRLEELLDRKVSIRLLPKTYAVFIR